VDLPDGTDTVRAIAVTRETDLIRRHQKEKDQTHVET
jgi:hypothetical protein